MRTKTIERIVSLYLYPIVTLSFVTVGSSVAAFAGPTLLVLFLPAMHWWKYRTDRAMIGRPALVLLVAGAVVVTLGAFAFVGFRLAAEHAEAVTGVSTVVVYDYRILGREGLLAIASAVAVLPFLVASLASSARLWPQSGSEWSREGHRSGEG